MIIRKIPALVLIALVTAANLYAQRILIDFGNNNSYRGTNVINPDTNGKFWNSVDALAYRPSLLDVNGATTTVGFGFTTAGATDYFNGPSGATGNPASAEIDGSALGLLGIKEAAYDYFASSLFTVQGFDPAKTYDLTFFGSHKFNAESTTVYTVYSSNDYGTAVVSAELFVHTPGAPWLHNSNKVARIKNIAPQFANSFWIGFQGRNGGDGYLNAMLIEEHMPPVAKDQTILIDFGNNGSFRGTNVINPDNRSNFWNSVSSGAPYLDMLNATGGTTDIDFEFISAGSTDSYNGPGGTNTEPVNIAIDAAALGDLGVNAAAFDWYGSSQIAISGLDHNRGYDITFFGSRKYSEDPVTVYSVYSESDFATVVASTNLVVCDPTDSSLHNSNRVAVLHNVVPQAASTLWIGFTGQTTSNGYINAMKITPSLPAAANVIGIRSINRTGSAIGMQFVGENGRTYMMQYTTNLLNGGGWQSLTNMIATGDGISTNLLTDSNLVETIRSYRLTEAP